MSFFSGYVSSIPPQFIASKLQTLLWIYMDDPNYAADITTQIKTEVFIHGYLELDWIYHCFLLFDFIDGARITLYPLQYPQNSS